MRLTRGWLAAVVPDGVLCTADGAAVIEVELPLEVARNVVSALAEDVDLDVLAATGVAPPDAELLVSRLSELGALNGFPASFPAGVTPLADAIAVARRDEELPARVATASELLVIPPGLTGTPARRLIRAFVSGLASHARVRAYGHAALDGTATVAGDSPQDGTVEAALEAAAALDPAAVHVVDLVDRSVQSALPEELDAIGASVVHRLGTALTCRYAGSPPPGAPDMRICMVRQAHPNLRFPGVRHGVATGIAEDDAEAELIARAEAAERFACGDLTGRALVRAREVDLDAPVVRPDAIVRYSARQLRDRSGDARYDADRPRLWTPGSTLDGDRRWLPAEMVFNPFSDPESPPPLASVTSSGSAAHTTFAEARRRAVAELIERDAFMWHWVQRLPRERIDDASLPAAPRRALADLRAAGRETDLVNLTLDTKPVVLCAIRGQDRLSIAASCRDDPADAAQRALREAATLLWSHRDAVPPTADLEAVRTPLDHLGVYRDPAHRDFASFLWSGEGRIAVDEIQAVDEPAEIAVRKVGEVVAVDIGSPGSRPFAVARAHVPGLVPLSFGFDREPLGVPRISQPIDLVDGRRMGKRLDLDEGVPILPHPFP
jgi:ribosomal protein S12 methylthiotransferase accessory factor